MRCVVKHPAGIDGLPAGAVGEFADTAPVRGLLAAGLLMAEGEVTSLAAGPRVAELEAALVAKDGRITELEVEVAQLRLDLEAATAPSSKSEG